jgi:Tol biopolymer transport system component
MPLSIRRFSSVAALILIAACGPREPADDPKASGGQTDPRAYSVEDFYKNTQFRGAAWSADGRKILVSSDLSGIWNAYAVSASGSAPQALTKSTTDSVFALSYFPTDERILYSSDEGGNELTHIYVQPPNASTADLTPMRQKYGTA